ncbi:MAG: lipo-like protein [Kordiimonadaceae bacterium]|nr:lipo-like protein [Kordiimonadaceae bacterium]
MFNWLKTKISESIIRYLERPVWRYRPFTLITEKELAVHLEPGDVLLIEGNQYISSIIKYLTQSTWSHACFYVGDAIGTNENGERLCLIEADAKGGVNAVPLSKYNHFNSRICRPSGLNINERKNVIDYVVSRIGLQYDMKNIIDLMRYLFPYPPVPLFFRRRMLALGSGDPTRAICSTLIAQAFQSVKYPILPRIEVKKIMSGDASFQEKEIYHIRHYSLFTPRDFDVSPYFKVVKPTIESGFDYKEITWSEDVDMPFNG